MAASLRFLQVVQPSVDPNRGGHVDAAAGFEPGICQYQSSNFPYLSIYLPSFAFVSIHRLRCFDDQLLHVISCISTLVNARYPDTDHNDHRQVAGSCWPAGDDLIGPPATSSAVAAKSHGTPTCKGMVRFTDSAWCALRFVKSSLH